MNICKDNSYRIMTMVMNMTTVIIKLYDGEYGNMMSMVMNMMSVIII